MVWLETFAPEIAVIVGMGASGIVALCSPHRSFARPGRCRPHFLIERNRAGSSPTPRRFSAYDLLNAVIVRLDVIMLGCFVGRAPGVTLTTLGIYGAAVEVAGGLRKINQAFNPIFAPIVAGLTAEGEQEQAAAAFSRVSQWMLWILLPLVAVMVLAGSVILGIYGPAFRQGGMWLGIVALACATNAFVSLAETVIMVQKPRLNLWNSIITCAVALAANFWLISQFGVTGAAFGILLPYVLAGHSSLSRAPDGLPLAESVGGRWPAAARCIDSNSPCLSLPHGNRRNSGSTHCRDSLSSRLRCSMALSSSLRNRRMNSLAHQGGALSKPPQRWPRSGRSGGRPSLMPFHIPPARPIQAMKRIFITGASSGIGLATAKLLAGRGDEVWGTSRDVSRIPQLPRLHPVRLDLRDATSLHEVSTPRSRKRTTSTP